MQKRGILVTQQNNTTNKTAPQKTNTKPTHQQCSATGAHSEPVQPAGCEMHNYIILSMTATIVMMCAAMGSLVSESGASLCFSFFFGPFVHWWPCVTSYVLAGLLPQMQQLYLSQKHLSILNFAEITYKVRLSPSLFTGQSVAFLLVFNTQWVFFSSYADLSRPLYASGAWPGWHQRPEASMQQETTHTQNQPRSWHVQITVSSLLSCRSCTFPS